MTLRHGNKSYLQVLLDPNRAELAKELADQGNMRLTAWIREAVYKVLKQETAASAYNAALAKDEALWRESVRRRVEGRMRSKEKLSDKPGLVDDPGVV